MEKRAYEKSVDRISQLPESVISEILCRLPTEDAIDTCFLSRSWRHRWKDLLQAFNFSVIPFKNQKGFIDQQGHMRFLSLVNDILLHHRRAPVRKLAIRYVADLDVDYAALNAWVYAAIGSHLEELKLAEGLNLMLPSPLFTCCTSLVNLELATCRIDAEELTQVRFPSLKKLKLGFRNPNLVTNILSGSPILETLDLTVATKLGAVFKIHSPSLKRLYYSDSFSSRTEVLEINTPLLEYLSLQIYTSQYQLISLCNSHNLLEANMDCYAEKNYVSYVPKLINSLCNVKSLVLHPYTRYCLVRATQFDLPEFRYLLNLEFAHWGLNTRFLFRMLERCPMLQVLTINQCQVALHAWTPPTNVPYCLASQLSTVNIKTYHGTKDDLLELIAYILQEGLALKSISIEFGYVPLNSEQGQRMINELSHLPKGSKMCQLHFK